MCEGGGWSWLNVRGPFDSVANDRLHDSAFPARALATLFSDGVVPNADAQLQVTESTPQAKSVTVGLGHGWVQGRHYQNYSAVKVITVANNTSGNPRIDRIVMRRSLTNRLVDIQIKNGTAAGVPVAPALTQSTTGDWEVSLAQIAVANNFTVITNANITDERTYVSATQTSPVPVGTVFPYAGTSAPSGYLFADGAAVSRTTYAALFALVGTTFGNPSGSQFNLPDIRGRAVIGLNVAHASHDTLGENDGLVAASRTVYHRHAVTDAGHSHGVTDPGHQHINNQFWTNSGSASPHWGSSGSGSQNTMVVSSSTTGISINGSTTGISVGTAGPFEAPAYITLPHIIKT